MTALLRSTVKAKSIEMENAGHECAPIKMFHCPTSIVFKCLGQNLAHNENKNNPILRLAVCVPLQYYSNASGALKLYTLKQIYLVLHHLAARNLSISVRLRRGTVFLCDSSQ